MVKANLKARRPDADEIILGRVDVDAAKLVFDTIESRRRSSVLYAMNLMDLVRRDEMSPELRSILKEETSRVQAGSLDGLIETGSATLFPGWEDRLAEESLDEQVREVLSLDVYQQVMRRPLRRPGREGGLRGRNRDDGSGQGHRPDAAPTRPWSAGCGRSCGTSSADVVRYALESASRHARREHVPLILPRLGDPALADAAASSLAAYGVRIAGTLGDALSDDSLSSAVRKAIPAVLARTAAPRSAAVLLRAMRGEADDPGRSRRDPSTALVRMRAEATGRGLSRGRRRHPSSAGPSRRPAEALEGGDLGGGALWRGLSSASSTCSAWSIPTRTSPGPGRTTPAGERRAVDHSIELLEHLLRRRSKDAVLPLLETRSKRRPGPPAAS